MKFLILFTLLTVINVVLQTVKSLVTVKCGKVAAATVNAIAYALYTYLIIFTAADGMSLHMKALITALANFVGVYAVKFFEEKARKDKLWELRITVENLSAECLHYDYDMAYLPHNFVNAGPWVIFNVYCETQEDTRKAKEIAEKYGAKMFASESKTL